MSSTSEQVAFSVDNPHQDLTDGSVHVSSQDATTDGAMQPLSKKARKKAAKAEFLLARKLERRAREKAAKKERKKEQREKEALEETAEEPERKKARTADPVQPFNARVVIDLAFDDLMTDKEIASLSGQLAYTYSTNRNARCPFVSLLFTSVHGKLRSRLDKQSDAAYRRWEGTEWWGESYTRLWSTEAALEKDTSLSSRSERDKVVYLTADAEEELEELKEGETYIIGGLCDHNRYKNLCLKKACEDGIRAARLPIGKYLSNMTTRKVLTVNQVFEILVRWTEQRDWEKALYEVMPKRKLQQQSESPTTPDQPESRVPCGADASDDASKSSEEGKAVTVKEVDCIS